MNTSLSGDNSGAISTCTNDIIALKLAKFSKCTCRKRPKNSNSHRICCFYPILTKFGTRANNIEESLVLYQELTKLGFAPVAEGKNFKLA